jgi:hypothetical protein
MVHPLAPPVQIVNSFILFNTVLNTLCWSINNYVQLPMLISEYALDARTIFFIGVEQSTVVLITFDIMLT